MPAMHDAWRTSAAATEDASPYLKLNSPRLAISRYDYQLPARSLSAKTSFAANNPLSAAGKPA